MTEKKRPKPKVRPRMPQGQSYRNREPETSAQRLMREHKEREKRLRPYRSAQGFWVGVLMAAILSAYHPAPGKVHRSLVIAFVGLVIYTVLLVYDPPADPDGARRLMARLLQATPGELALCAWFVGKDVRIATSSSFWEISVQVIAALMIALTIDLRGFAFPRFAYSLPALIFGPVALFSVIRGGYDCLEALMIAPTGGRASVGWVCAAMVAAVTFIAIRALTAHFEDPGVGSPFGQTSPGPTDASSVPPAHVVPEQTKMEDDDEAAKV